MVTSSPSLDTSVFGPRQMEIGDVAYVVSVSEARCKCLFEMFYIFQTHVESVYMDVAYVSRCKCFPDVAYVYHGFKCFFKCSGICFKYFIILRYICCKYI